MCIHTPTRLEEGKQFWTFPAIKIKACTVVEGWALFGPGRESTKEGTRQSRKKILEGM